MIQGSSSQQSMSSQLVINLIYFISETKMCLLTYKRTSFLHLVKKETGKRVTWGLPFAVVGVNITCMLIQMLDLGGCKKISNICMDMFCILIIYLIILFCILVP